MAFITKYRIALGNDVVKTPIAFALSSEVYSKVQNTTKLYEVNCTNKWNLELLICSKLIENLEVLQVLSSDFGYGVSLSYVLITAMYLLLECILYYYFLNKFIFNAINL